MEWRSLALLPKIGNTMSEADTTDPLVSIIASLKPLTSEERRRTVDAAMLYLGESSGAIPPMLNPANVQKAKDAVGGGYPDAVRKWASDNEISNVELDRVYDFKDDGSFVIHDAPGRSKKDKTLNAYILAGVGKFLTTNDRAFDDKLARGFCEVIGCYDSPNHAKYLAEKGAEFSGDKSKGYSLSNVGLRRAAALVKELASTDK